MKYFLSPTVYLFSLIMFGFLCALGSPDAMSAAVVQRRVQAQKAAQQQMIQQYQQQMVAQQQAQQVAAYQQAMAQQQAVAQQQAAYQKAAAEYAAYKQAMQQAMAQKQAVEVAAYQKAVAQKQMAEATVMQQAQQQAQQVAAVQQAVAYKRTADVAQYQQAVRTKQTAEVAQQVALNQEIGQYADFLMKRKAALAAQGVLASQAQTAQQLAQYNQYQQVRAAQAKAAVASKLQAQGAQNALGAKMAQDVLSSKTDSGNRVGNEAAEKETVVGIQDLWKALDLSSVSWGKIIDNEIKTLTVAEYIDRFKKAGIGIKKSPGQYVTLIDSIAANDSGYLEAPFMNVLSYAAIVEYDFDNGQNKDELARRVLGETSFQANKARMQGH